MTKRYMIDVGIVRLRACDTKAEAIAWAKEYLGADDEGRLQVVREIVREIECDNDPDDAPSEPEPSPLTAAGKACWLTRTQAVLPIGTRVKVVASDVEDYVGLRGHVTGYDPGDVDCWPLVSVQFDPDECWPEDADEPLVMNGGLIRGDGFYFLDGDDTANEIVKEN